jgi:LuxR family transcriptional regulator, maltose regulon positive regulatory protein
MSDPSSSPLVLTKLLPPRLRTEHLDRRDLWSRLEAGRPRLTLLNAPAGYGKTTLLAWWQHGDARKPFAWISLDEGDRDPRRFWSYVREAVSRIDREATGLGGTDPGARSGNVTRVALPELINSIAALPRAVVLVLEDYHRLGDSEVHDQLAVLLERKPANLDVVVSTRTDPPLPLSRLRATLELVELTADDLRFDATEASILLNDRLDLGLSEASVGRLLERTEGWPAGLYLAGLAVAKSSDREGELERFTSSHHHVMEYFAAEVLAGLSTEERAFLRRAAVLSEVSGPLLDAVLNTSGSGLELRRLERTNLLVPRLDGEPEVYRFHVIFGELLGNMLLDEEPERVSDLHLRASAWYAEQGAPARAIEHALAAGRTDAAAELIVAQWQPLADHVHNESFATWLSALPDEQIAADPRLALAAAWTAGWGGIEGGWQDWLERIELPSPPVELPMGLGSIEAGIALTRAVFGFDDVRTHLAAAREAAALFAGRPGLQAIADGSLGVALLHAGLLAEARSHLAANVDRLATEFPSVLGPALSYLSLAFTDDGEPAEGQRFAELARRRSGNGAGRRHAGATGLVGLAFGAALRGLDRPADALPELDEAIEHLGQVPMRIDLAKARIERSLALHAVGRDLAASVELDHASAIVASCADCGAVTTQLQAATAKLRHDAGGEAARGRLSERELEVLALLPGDLSRREIAAALFVSFNTIQTHMRSIYRKLGVTSREQAVVRARGRGLIAEDPPPRD